MRIKLILAGGILLLAVHASFAAGRLLTVEDAVATRRIVTKTTRSEVALSPDGTQVAFIVKAPDIKKNLNIYQLYLRNVAQTRGRENGRILFHAESLAGVQWLRNGKELAVISTEGGLQPEDKLNLIDVRSGKVETIASPTKRIRAFSMDADGRRIVFCAAVRKMTGSTGQELRNRYGFRIASDERFIDASETNNWFPDSYLYFVDRGAGKGPKVTQLHPLAPSGGSVDLFIGALDYLSLSPNGRYCFSNTEQTRYPIHGPGSSMARNSNRQPFRCRCGVCSTWRPTAFDSDLTPQPMRTCTLFGPVTVAHFSSAA